MYSVNAFGLESDAPYVPRDQVGREDDGKASIIHTGRHEAAGEHHRTGTLPRVRSALLQRQERTFVS